LAVATIAAQAADREGRLPPNASVNQAAARIRDEGTVTSEYIGLVGRPSPVHAAFKQLEAKADDAALRRFAADRSPALRVYAFYAAADRHPERVPFDLLRSRIADVEEVELLEADVLDRAVVRDLLLARVEPRLSTAQRTELLERLLATKVTPGVEHALRFWTVDERLYPALRERAAGGLAPALPAIARFRREEDVPLIARGLETARFDALGAVAEFPSPQFLPALAEIQRGLLLHPPKFSMFGTRDIVLLRGQPPSPRRDHDSVCRLYQAILAYPDAAARPLLERALGAPQAPARQLHGTCIAAALDPAALGSRADLAFRAWERADAFSPELLDAFSRIDPRRTQRDMAQTFDNVNAYDDYTLLPLLIRFVREHDPAPASVLNHAIGAADASHFDKVAVALRELRDPSSLPLLLDRLMKRAQDGSVVVEWNPAVYRPALDAILKYSLDARQKRWLRDWILDQAPQRRAKWVLERADLESNEADLQGLIQTHGLDAGAAPRAP
jgi:hypothetical protein